MEKWTKEKAWDCSGWVEMWQEYNHAQKVETIRRELALAKQIGFNAVRQFLAFDVWMYLDPMLATGGSAIDAISQIKTYNPKSIKFMGIIAAPEGLQALTDAHPDVDVYLAALDEKLNEHKYIVPGLGDAGDRIFGTK